MKLWHPTRLAKALGLFLLLLLFWFWISSALAWAELPAAAVAAALGTALAFAGAGESRSHNAVFPLAAPEKALRTLLAIVPDALAVLAVVPLLLWGRRHGPHFAIVEERLPVAEVLSPGRRASAVILGSLAPRSIIIDLDREHRRVLVHRLLSLRH